MIGVKSVATSFEGSLVASTLPMASPVVEFLRNVVRGNDMSWQRIERVRLSLGLTTKQLSYQILSSNRDKCRIELDAIGGMMRAAPWGREQLPHLTRRELVKKHHSKNTPARGRQSREKQHDEELPLPPPPPPTTTTTTTTSGTFPTTTAKAPRANTPTQCQRLHEIFVVSGRPMRQEDCNC